MRTTEEQLSEILHRKCAIQARRQKARIGSLSGLSVLLTAALAIGFIDIGNLPPGIPAQTVYGSMLLGVSAGGYVLAGVAAFMTGVVVTVLCIRRRKNMKHKERMMNNEKKNR
ncbi:MAG: hypothetical protein LKJ90_02745 [Faecalibacterium sp.]|jgi:uncharacterized membrane protein YozB (DUF420 family)|nr:hypothetical protein [Faecalibacterium sp.]